MKFNKELAEAAVARIEADPEAWVQGAWHHRRRSAELGRPAGCFALHVALAAGLELIDPTGSNEAFVATEKSDSLGFGRFTVTVWEGDGGDFRRVEAVALPGNEWEADVSAVASFLLVGYHGDPSLGERRARDAVATTFESNKSLDDIKALIAEAAGEARAVYAIRHANSNDRHIHASRVVVDGKEAVKAFLANLDVDDLEFVSVRRLED